MNLFIANEYYIIFRVAAGMALLVYLGTALLYWLEVVFRDGQTTQYYKFLRNCSIVICVFQALYLLPDLYNNVQKLAMQVVVVSVWKYVLLNSWPLILSLVIFSIILHRLYDSSRKQQERLTTAYFFGLMLVTGAVMLVQSFFLPNLVDAAYSVEQGKSVLMSMQGRFFAREMAIYCVVDAFIDFSYEGAFWTKR